MSWKIGPRFHRRTDFKMTLWYILSFSISTLVICTFLYISLRHQLLKEIDQLLLDETEEMKRVLSREPDETTYLMRFEDEVMSRKYYPFFFRILDGKGQLIYTSRVFQEIGYASEDQVWINARNGRETREEIHAAGGKRPFRIISTPFFNNGKLTYVIQLGTHLHFLRKNLSGFKNHILSALPIILALGSFGGWMLARKSLSPIGYIVSKTKTLTPENLSERLAPRGAGDEMDDLIHTINGMIGRLENSFKRMAEFTTDVSHELKTPLCAMRGEAEVLLSKERTAEEYQEGLAHFIEEFDHLNQMINDLILLSKSDAAHVELKKIPLRLDLLIRNICSLFQILAEQKGITLEVDETEEVMVIGDKVRLQRVFTNLIDNAIKYTLKGSIHVTLEKNKENVLVKVRDTGIGIPHEEREKIFKRFYRVDKSRSKETGGVGLGLNIAEWIVHAHHGRIECKSELNHGSTFTVSLPIQQV
jgi:heavy metal sensor kinase